MSSFGWSKTLDVQQSLFTLRLQAAAVAAGGGDFLRTTPKTAAMRSTDRLMPTSAFRVYCRPSQRRDGEFIRGHSIETVKDSNVSDQPRHVTDAERHHQDNAYSSNQSIHLRHSETVPCCVTSIPSLPAAEFWLDSISGLGAYGKDVDDQGCGDRAFVWKYIQERLRMIETANRKRNEISRSDERQLQQLQPTDALTSSRDRFATTGSSSFCWTIAVEGKRMFCCCCCSYSTNRKNNLKRHVMAMHDESKDGGRGTGIDGVIMECCGSQFDCKATLRDHISSAHRDRGLGFECPSCGRQFGRKAMLSRHLAVHGGRKDYRCTACNYSTSHKSNLLRHLKVHVPRPISNDVIDDVSVF